MKGYFNNQIDKNKNNYFNNQIDKHKNNYEEKYKTGYGISQDVLSEVGKSNINEVKTGNGITQDVLSEVGKSIINEVKNTSNQIVKNKLDSIMKKHSKNKIYGKGLREYK
jgi:hypothetical protein